MAQTELPIEQLSRYGRVARNSLMLLVMEPSSGSLADVEEAREAISEDAIAYLNEVEEGVESPYFTTYNRQDSRFIDRIAADKIRQAKWDRVGIFEVDPRIRMPESAQAVTATFAYLAASCMRQVRAPFYAAPSLRMSVRGPRNLAEFVRTVGTVKTVTHQARGKHFHDVVQTNDWRVAFAFWESTKWLAQTMRFSRAG